MGSQRTWGDRGGGRGKESELGRRGEGKKRGGGEKEGYISSKKELEISREWKGASRVFGTKTTSLTWEPQEEKSVREEGQTDLKLKVDWEGKA